MTVKSGAKQQMGKLKQAKVYPSPCHCCMNPGPGPSAEHPKPPTAVVMRSLSS